MERYIIILCLSVLSIGASVQQVSVQLANRGSTITLKHEGSEFSTDETTLAVDCRGGTVILTLRNEAIAGQDKPILQSGRIRIAEDISADGTTACSSGRKVYKDGIVARSTQNEKCGRKDSEDKEYFTWNVGIIEYDTETLDKFERLVRSNVLVKCAKVYEAQSSGEQNVPAVIPLGAHTSSHDMSFKFDKVTDTSNNFNWFFKLTPDKEFADGYSYEIDDLVIHTGQNTLSEKLIEASCVMDKKGTFVTPNGDGSAKIEVRPFQFASEPDAKITLTVTVAVCETTSENKCTPVRPEEKCLALPEISEEHRRMRSRRQVFESFQKKSVVFKATVAV